MNSKSQTERSYINISNININIFQDILKDYNQILKRQFFKRVKD